MKKFIKIFFSTFSIGLAVLLLLTGTFTLAYLISTLEMNIYNYFKALDILEEYRVIIFYGQFALSILIFISFISALFGVTRK